VKPVSAALLGNAPFLAPAIWTMEEASPPCRARNIRIKGPYFLGRDAVDSAITSSGLRFLMKAVMVDLHAVVSDVPFAVEWGMEAKHAASFIKVSIPPTFPITEQTLPPITVRSDFVLVRTSMSIFSPSSR
jgi:hypothetical protein